MRSSTAQNTLDPYKLVQKIFPLAFSPPPPCSILPNQRFDGTLLAAPRPPVPYHLWDAARQSSEERRSMTTSVTKHLGQIQSQDNKTSAEHSHGLGHARYPSLHHTYTHKKRAAAAAAATAAACSCCFHQVHFSLEKSEVQAEARQKKRYTHTHHTQYNREIDRHKHADKFGNRAPYYYRTWPRTRHIITHTDTGHPKYS